jgi:hypothetical protein
MTTNTIYKFGDGDYVKFEDYEKLQKALKIIYHYDDNKIWWVDRDDAANGMLRIAGVALGLEEE